MAASEAIDDRVFGKDVDGRACPSHLRFVVVSRVQVVIHVTPVGIGGADEGALPRPKANE